MPKVSICIPAYNQIEYLRRTIDSVILQSFTDYEIIITDDSISDVVKDLVNEYDQIDKIKYFRNTKSLGSPENWNESLRRSTGEYIKIMHHDDWFYDKNSLGKYVALLDENPTTDFAFAATLVASEKDKDYIHKLNQHQIFELSNDPLLLFKNNIVGAPSTIIFRRKEDLLFDKNMKWLVDLDFYIRILSTNKNFEYSNDVLTVTFKAGGRVTEFCENNMEIEIFEYFYLINKLNKNPKLIRSKGFRRAIVKVINICKKYTINSIDEVRSSGYNDEIPKLIQFYLKINAFSKFLGRVYYKLINVISYNDKKRS